MAVAQLILAVALLSPPARAHLKGPLVGQTRAHLRKMPAVDTSAVGLRRGACAVLLVPYFVLLFASLHAPAVPLPLPGWGRKGVLPLGRELSPSLRTLSPHVWPHPIWAAQAFLIAASLPRLLFALLVLGVPLLGLEHHAYLDRLKELPAHGFVVPTFGIVHGWRTFFLLALPRVHRPARRA